jgi:phytoene dehydrogenase-like protein
VRSRSPVRITGVVVALVVGLGGCGLLGSAGPSRACGLIEELDGIAAGFARTDPADPEAFDRALGSAADRYAALGNDLRDRLPDDLRDGLDRHLAAVRQYRFGDAATDRRAIDTWAADECDRRAPQTTTAP